MFLNVIVFRMWLVAKNLCKCSLRMKQFEDGMSSDKKCHLLPLIILKYFSMNTNDLSHWALKGRGTKGSLISYFLMTKIKPFILKQKLLNYEFF